MSSAATWQFLVCGIACRTVAAISNLTLPYRPPGACPTGRQGHALRATMATSSSAFEAALKHSHISFPSFPSSHFHPFPLFVELHALGLSVKARKPWKACYNYLGGGPFRAGAGGKATSPEGSARPKVRPYASDFLRPSRPLKDPERPSQSVLKLC